MRSPFAGWTRWDTFMLGLGLVLSHALVGLVIVGALCLIGYGIEQAIVRAWHFQ